MPSILFSPLGTLIGWNKAERLFTFLTEAVLKSAPAATPFRSEMAPTADGSAVTILSPRVTRTHPKITRSSRGQMQSGAAGFRESMASGSLWSYWLGQDWVLLVNGTLHAVPQLMFPS